MFISLQSKSCKMSVQTGFEISRPTWDDFFIKIGPEVICLRLNHFYMNLWTYLKAFTCKVISFAQNNVGWLKDINDCYHILFRDRL